MLTIMGDDRAVRATYIAGDLAYDRTSNDGRESRLIANVN